MRFSRRNFLKLSGLAGAAAALAGCGGSPSPSSKKAAEKDLLLHLAFDEGAGLEAADSAARLDPAEVKYQFVHAVYTDPMEPQWRRGGVSGGTLLFDGCSTCISYKPEELCVSGKSFSISLWAAPRAFEWDDPNGADNGNYHLTALVSQYSKQVKQGFVLGYQRFGRLCFEVGTGEKWYSLWAEKGAGNLNRCAWNQITAVFDGENGSMELFLNGTSVGRRTIDPGTAIAPAERENLLIGKNSHPETIAAGTYQMFCGLMDEVKLYSRALKAEELPAVQPAAIPYEDIGLENCLTNDVFKTQFHGGPYAHWMNEPHAPLYYNGMYHLFFQSNSIGTYWRNISWGHLISEDMVHWRPLPDAIVPTENSVVPDGVWSGGAALDKNGLPLLFFTAGNDSFARDGLISNQNVGLAWPADTSDPELKEWVIYDKLAVTQLPGQGRAGEFRDASVWKEGETWCMIICSGSTQSDGGSALLYTTETLEVKADGTVDMNWQYRGPVYEMPNQSMVYGTSWELPLLYPLTNMAGQTKYFFAISPAPASLADNKVYYFLGDFDLTSGKFTPDASFGDKPALLDYGSNVFTGPSLFLDPVSGDLCIFSIMQDQRSGAEEGAAGWAHCVGLTRRLWLSEDGKEVCMAPIDALTSLQDEVLLDESGLTLEDANAKLTDIRGDLLYIRAVFAPQDCTAFGLLLKVGGKFDETKYSYDCTDGSIHALTQSRGAAAPAGDVSGPLALDDGRLRMEMYIDRSLIEGFFNDRKSISMRSYSDFDSQGIHLFADGALTLDSLYIARLHGIF